jgi:hypothetical protein
MWDWAEETQIKPNDLKKNLILSKNNYVCITWHLAAALCSNETLQLLWNFSKEAEINTEELLLAETGKVYTAFQIAAVKNQVETLKKMWFWAENHKSIQELKKKLFLATDMDRYIARHRTAEKGNLESLEILWVWSKEVEVDTYELLIPGSGK